ncbi:MAG: PIN domain-containing protein [Agriterribacter sp.]
MDKIYVLDTCAIISYFNQVFLENSTISGKTLSIMKRAFDSGVGKMIIPSIVFIELYYLFADNREMTKRIYYDVFYKIKELDNFHIHSLDKEVLNEFISIDNFLDNEKFDNHDKQILATAIVMNCTLITSDSRIKAYNDRRKKVDILN